MAAACWLLVEAGLGEGGHGEAGARTQVAASGSLLQLSGWLLWTCPLPATFLHPSPGKCSLRKPCQRPPRERPGLAERDVQKPPTLQLPIRWILLPDRVQEIRSLLLPGLITASRAAALAAREIPAACKPQRSLLPAVRSIQSARNNYTSSPPRGWRQTCSFSRGWKFRTCLCDRWQAPWMLTSRPRVAQVSPGLGLSGSECCSVLGGSLRFLVR